MKFIRRVLPNLCIAMTLALVTLLILDSFNPLLGLLRGWPFLILSLLDAAAPPCSTATRGGVDAPGNACYNISSGKPQIFR